jgi:lambda family phage portal protein
MAAPALALTWFDRALGVVAPRLHLQRMKARIALDMLRHYEGAAAGRRTQGWSARSSDPNAAASGATLARLRDVARDLVRNNAYAKSAVDTITQYVVGRGIVARPLPASPGVLAQWQRWAESTDCDADGRENFVGLQKLVMQAVFTDGEVLVRRRWRRPGDGYALPVQLQILEADFLDTAKTMILPTGGAIIQGVEFDALGNRVAYWLFQRHPGSPIGGVIGATSNATLFTQSKRYDAVDVLHIYARQRPGQVRGPSWFAPVILRLKDFDDYEDATLMKQKVAACLSVITSDVDGTAPAMGVASAAETTGNPDVDTLSPGSILNVAPGRSVDVVQPPSVSDHDSYSTITLRAIAGGLGLGYEDLTGDYSKVNYSSARMARLRMWARVEDWRSRMIVPQFCDPAWDWAMQAATLIGAPTADDVDWTAPPLPMIEPDKEWLAAMRAIRNGKPWSEVMREMGYDPTQILKESADDFKAFDDNDLVFDCDPRRMTQAGQVQSAGALASPADPSATPPEPAE